MQIQQLCTVNTFTRLTIKSKHIKLIVCFEHNRILQCQWEKEVDIFVFIINFLDQRELLEWVWMTSTSVVMQKKINIQPFRNLFFLLSTGNYVLGYLASRPKLVHYVLQALVQVCIVWLICRNLSNVIEFTIVFYLHTLSLHLVTLKRLFPKTKSYTFIQIDLINIKFMI